MDHASTVPSRRRLSAAGLQARFGPDAVALLFITAVFLVMRAYAVIHASPEAFPDTQSYATINFLGYAPRTWGLPLLWNLVPGGPSSDAFAQMVLATLAWLFLALTVLRLARDRRAGIGGYALVLLTGLGVQITEWDFALLSESFTLTLIVVLLAFVMLAVDRLTPLRALGLGLTLCWWAAVRPSNFTILAVAFVPLLIGLLLTRRRDVILWVAVPLVIITAWSAFSSSRDDVIWPQNSTGVIQDRLLRDPNAKEYLHEHGMPRSALVEEETGKDYIGYNSPLSNDPAFRKWLFDDFQPAYIEYLLRHPGYTFGNPIKNAPELISSRTGYSASMEVLPVTVKSVLWPHELDLPFLLVAVMALGLFALFLTRSWSRLLVPLLGQALGWGWLIVTWHLASPDLKRILAPASTVIHLTAVLIVIFAIDALMAERRRRLRMAAEPVVVDETPAPAATDADAAQPTSA